MSVSRSRSLLRSPVLVAALTLACANPAADKPHATVAEAKGTGRAASALALETYDITPLASKIGFVGAKITASHVGGFQRFSGKAEKLADGSGRVSVEIETDSLFADSDRLTGHLKSSDFFDVAKFPKATFVSTRIEPKTGDDYTIMGDLDLHGIKKSITFPAKVQKSANGLAVKAEFSINRKDFGIVYPGLPDDLIRDDVVIKLDLQAKTAP